MDYLTNDQIKNTNHSYHNKIFWEKIRKITPNEEDLSPAEILNKWQFIESHLLDEMGRCICAHEIKTVCTMQYIGPEYIEMELGSTCVQRWFPLEHKKRKSVKTRRCSYCKEKYKHRDSIYCKNCREEQLKLREIEIRLLEIERKERDEKIEVENKRQDIENLKNIISDMEERIKILEAEKITSGTYTNSTHKDILELVIKGKILNWFEFLIEKHSRNLKWKNAIEYYKCINNLKDYKNKLNTCLNFQQRKEMAKLIFED